jgi:chromosome segregation ATPase
MIEELKQVLGISNKIQTHIETDLVAARKQVTDLTAALETERTAAVQLKADLATATQTIGSLQAKIVELENAAIAAAATAAAAAPALAASTDTNVAIRAATITASQGVPPLAIKPAAEQPATDGKPIDPKLKGRARLIAHTEAQLNAS